MYNFNEIYPDYDVSTEGIVYKNGKAIKPFKSNGYLQVLLFDRNHKRRICGVHTIVAMKYLNWYEGCNVHHKDKCRSNNVLSNLVVVDSHEHGRMHALESIADGTNGFIKQRGKEPWNKGKKMSAEFRAKCSESAKRRWAKSK